MPAHRFSVWHNLFIAFFTVILGYTEYRGLHTFRNWPPLLAGLISVATVLMTLMLWQPLTANATRFEAPLASYHPSQLILWALVVVLSFGYSLVLTMYLLVGIGIQPGGPVLMVGLSGGYIGSYLFKRTFVPQSWGPFATSRTTL